MLSSEDLKYAYRETRKLKSEYRGKISVAVWSHRGSGHEFKINTPPFDNLLPCGAGYTNFVISQSGLIRPCELLPEELFNMGSVDLFDDFIKGKYGDRLKNSVNNFNFELSKQGVGLDSICTPLKILYEKFKNDIN